MNTKQCTCITLLDKAFCKHLIAACLKNNIIMNCLIHKTNTLRTLRRKGKKQMDDSTSKQIDDTPLSADVSMNITEVSPIPPPIIQKRGRGRPTKAEKALCFEKPMVELPIRTSSRIKKN